MKLLQIPGYRTETDNLINTEGMARLCMLIQEDLKYSRRLDLQNDTEPNITITVNLGRQKINIIGYYRQWQTLLNNNKVQGSGSINKQTTRIQQNSEILDKINKRNRDNHAL